MADLELHLQPGNAGPESTADLRAQTMRKRIAALPPFDMDARMEGLSGLLAEAGRPGIGVEARAELLALFVPEIDDLDAGYREQVSHYTFPLTAPQDSRYRIFQALLTQAVSACKRLILDLLEQPDDTAQARLHASIMQCMDYMTRQALQAYAVYREPDASLWEDLHRLYAYAEKKQLATDVVEHLSDLSIHGAYARVLLLAMANPGHLLQGEIYQTAEKLGKWGLAVRLEHPEELPPAPLDELLEGRYFCDLDGCSPPGFGISDLNGAPRNPRRLNLDEVIRIINDRMKTLALDSQRSLPMHAEWDLLLRLRRAWEKRQLRKDDRKPECGVSVKAVVSLSSCHYFFSGYQPFEPEKDEVRLHGDSFQQPRTLSLVSTESTPWLDAETETKLESGLLKPRGYRFDLERNENDIWKKSHLTATHQESTIEKRVEARMLDTIYEFDLVNTSAGGEGLETRPESGVQLRVGELLALFPHDEEDEEPALHVVRWIQAGTEQTLRLGVNKIPGQHESIAVRALDEQAVYRDYVRAFLVEDGDHASIIVPAGQFECGTRLVVNDGDTLRLFRLGSLQESTRAFSRFRYEPETIDTPDSDRIVTSLKSLLNPA